MVGLHNFMRYSMIEQEPVNEANEEEQKRRAAGAESVHEAPEDANASRAPKEEARSGLRSQGVVDTVAAKKPAFARAYNKAPKLERPFEAVDMDEKADTVDAVEKVDKEDSLPLVTGPVIKPTEDERTRMPADEPPAAPTPPGEPEQLKEAEPIKAAPDAKKMEAENLETPIPPKTKGAEGTESDEAAAS